MAKHNLATKVNYQGNLYPLIATLDKELHAPAQKLLDADIPAQQVQSIMQTIVESTLMKVKLLQAKQNGLSN